MGRGLLVRGVIARCIVSYLMALDLSQNTHSHPRKKKRTKAKHSMQDSSSMERENS